MFKLEELRPFHETIINAIKRCRNPRTEEAMRLLKLIQETRIPENHDVIIYAIENFFLFPPHRVWAEEIRMVEETKAIILAQKKALEKAGEK